MSDIYVEVTKEHLQQVRSSFDRQVVRFLHDFRQRRISYLMLRPKEVRVLGICIKKLVVDRSQAEILVDTDPDEQTLATQIRAGLDRLKEIFVTAAAAPEGTKFIVTLDDYQWFLADGATA
ncbi:hypothetical protein [Hyphomicrobium sp. ghe19]|uniref:hypothetical protein n=1 Tax=Hyphomicrobium sp. ghe19 TaxID=2682968 RepID=UPI0013675C83|nr:hypothetical protein HYPP_02403 [Hyphomicrobium sp. ghe19]